MQQIKVSQFSSVKIWNKNQNLLKILKPIQGGIKEIPPHHIYQIYHFLFEWDDFTPPKCGELSDYTDSAHTKVEDPSLGYMNGSNICDRCEHNTRQLHPSCTACRRTANLPGLFFLNAYFGNGLLFSINSKGSFYALYHRQDSTYHSSSCSGGSGFPIWLSEWSFTICPKLYSHK